MIALLVDVGLIVVGLILAGAIALRSSRGMVASLMIGVAVLCLVAAAYVGGRFMIRSLTIADQATRDMAYSKSLASGISELGLEAYAGIRLGMSESEVLYEKGSPVEEPRAYWPTKSYDADPYYRLLFEDGTAVFFDRRFNEDKYEVIAVSCREPYSCASLANIGIGTPEGDLIEMFGRSMWPEKLSRDGIKTYEYGPGQGNVLFNLSQHRVKSIVLVDRQRWPRDQMLRTNWPRLE